MSPYLRKTIMATLAAVALTAVSSSASAAHICSDNSCWYVPDPVDPPEPIYTPPVFDDPYPGDQGGDNSGDGGGGDPAPTPDFVACSNLLNTKPHGCTRELAAAGQQTPTSLIPSSWQALGQNEEFPFFARDFRNQLNALLVALNMCYADVFKDPLLCELEFVAQLGTGSTIKALGRALGPWEYGEGFTEIFTSFIAAPVARETASWAGAVDVSVGGAISINFGAVVASFASLNRFNAALYNTRLQKSCTFWVGAWDQARCP